MRRTFIIVVLAIVTVFSPSQILCSFAPDIRVAFEGWGSNSESCVLRKTVIDTADDSVKEDVLYIVDLSSSRIKIERRREYSAQALEDLSLVKVGPVKRSELGAPTFIVGANQYIYVDYHTVMEDVGASSYTIHRRIWTLNEGIARMMFKEDESFSGVSTRRERASEAYLSPDLGKLLILFDISSHFMSKGFVVLDLARSQIVEKRIRELE